MYTDYYGKKLTEGDIVTFPSAGEFMDGKIIKFKENRRNIRMSQAFVENTSGYRKWKYLKDLINKTHVTGQRELDS